MLYTHDRNAMRQVFYEAWNKAKLGKILTALESQVVDVIQAHPEYHAMLEGKETIPDDVQQQPFLHLGLHLAIRDQLRLDKPAGIQHLFQQLSALGVTPLDIEHYMMACLSQVMWEAQQQQRPVDEQHYRTLLSALIKEKK